MESLQLLLNKIIEIGNLLAGVAANGERDSEDIQAIGKAFSTLKDRVAATEGRLGTLETYREETQEVAKSLLLTKPGRQSNIIAIIAISIAVISCFVSIYFNLHPVHP